MADHRQLIIRDPDSLKALVTHRYDADNDRARKAAQLLQNRWVGSFRKRGIELKVENHEIAYLPILSALMKGERA